MWVYCGKPTTPSDAHRFTAVKGSTVWMQAIPIDPSSQQSGIRRLQRTDGASRLANEFVVYRGKPACARGPSERRCTAGGSVHIGEPGANGRPQGLTIKPRGATARFTTVNRRRDRPANDQVSSVDPSPIECVGPVTAVNASSSSWLNRIAWACCDTRGSNTGSSAPAVLRTGKI